MARPPAVSVGALEHRERPAQLLTPFCVHEQPIAVTIVGEPPVYIVACTECGASGPKQLPGVEVAVAIDAWNRHFGVLWPS